MFNAVRLLPTADYLRFLIIRFLNATSPVLYAGSVSCLYQDLYRVYCYHSVELKNKTSVCVVLQRYIQPWWIMSSSSRLSIPT